MLRWRGKRRQTARWYNDASDLERLQADKRTEEMEDKQVRGDPAGSKPVIWGVAAGIPSRLVVSLRGKEGGCRGGGIMVCCRDRAGRHSGIDKLGHLHSQRRAGPIVSQCRTTDQDPHGGTGVTLFTSTSLLHSRDQSCRRLGCIVLVLRRFELLTVASLLTAELETIRGRGGKSRERQARNHTDNVFTNFLSLTSDGGAQGSRPFSLDKPCNNSAPMCQLFPSNLALDFPQPRVFRLCRGSPAEVNHLGA